MLSQKDLSLLYNIISNKNQTFEDISKTFNTKFNNDSQVKAATSLLILLEDNVLNIHQRIISYYILYVLSNKEKMETNPFLSFVLERLRKSNNKGEQNFLIDFLCCKINYLNLTIDNYLNYVKGNTIQDGKKFLKKELKLHNEKLRAILIK